MNELVIAAAGLVLFTLVTGWFHHSLYEWVFPVICALTAVLALLTLIMMIRFIKTAKASSVIRGIYNVFAILFAVINVAFVVMMQLWR